MTELFTTLTHVLRDVDLFSLEASGTKLREYQREVAEAIVDSVINRHGRTFVVIFPRQSGKNELQAQIETYLLVMFSKLDAEMVKISPTWKPQSLNAMRRLERVLRRNLFARGQWKKVSGYIYQYGTARITFLSGSPTAQVVGATASRLLECDEAQDVLAAKWDKEINPMAASTNATRVFWGTAWTSQTLLAREERLALEAEKQDGVRRVWHIDALTVGSEVEPYRKFVEGEIARLGRNHPFIRSQFFSEVTEAQGGMFPPERLALMRGDHSSQAGPRPDALYAFAVDVGGEDLASPPQDWRQGEQGSRRDSSVLTIAEVDLISLADPLVHSPTYRIVARRRWTGASHTAIYSQIKALAEFWQPRRIVVDATGIGEPLASFLDKAYPHAVLPFKLSQASKSELGWKLLSIIETGRFKEARDPSEEQEQFFKQCSYTTADIQPGPGRVLRWCVEDGTRDPTSGKLVHDDFVLSVALFAALEDEHWGTAESRVIQPYDPLKELAF